MAESRDHTDSKAERRAVLEALRDDPEALIAIIGHQAERIEALQAQMQAMRAEMQEQIALLRQRVRTLDEQNRRLRQQREAAKQAGKRQAAPFRLAPHKRASEPASPGRKQGHAGSYRRAPEHIDERVEVKMSGCPECGGAVTDIRPIRQVVEEIPPIRPQVVEVVTYRGDCPECGLVETRHGLQTSRATGAAAVHLGPRAQALALMLRERHGLTMRRVCAILEEGFGLDLSPGGLAALVQRCAGRLAAEHRRLVEAARSAEVQYVDETSWWVAHPRQGVSGRDVSGRDVSGRDVSGRDVSGRDVSGRSSSAQPLWWLWVFADAHQTLYRVDPRRRRAVVHEVLGADFPGVLVSDCLNIYDEATPVQHKCYAHHLRAIAQAREDYAARTGELSGYLLALRAVLLGAQGLKQACGEMTPEAVQTRRAALEARADRLLRPGRADSLTETEDKVRRRLRKQRDHLFTFLDHDQVEATNNRAERQLRPAVLRRKLSCGNRTPRGAKAFGRVASVLETCVQQGRSGLEYLRATMSLDMEPRPLR